jgi:2-desacetyl-2-hydroxyethyl bacteriochlorophyllide A dehydrogenase
MKAQALWFQGPEKIEIREEALAPVKSGQVLIQSEYSAISAGSEMLVYRNLIPANIATDVNLPSLTGKFSYPLKYGYSLSGRIVQVGNKKDEHLLGKTVFTFHPHQSLVIANTDAVMLVPEHLSNKAAPFLPNMESALSFVMDGQPVVGERVIVFGQGIVGLLTTGILSKFPLSQLICVDPVAKRRKISKDLGATAVFDPIQKKFEELVISALGDGTNGSNSQTGADLIFELSGNPEALQKAIDLTAFGGRIIVGSWYGNQNVSLQLGGNFHRRQIQIISSQVSSIHPRFSGGWSKQRRFEVAWKMISDLQPTQLISHEIPFLQAEQAYELLAERNNKAIQIILTYGK